MSSYYRTQLEDYLKTLDVEGIIFDIGGAQLPIKGRVKSWSASNYFILDLPNPHKGNEPDIKYNIDYENGRGVWLNNKSLNGMPDRIEADIIFCLEVFEYVCRPLVALKNIFALLKDSGIAYISFPYTYPLHPPEGKDMLRYTKNSVYKLCDMAGLKIIKYIPRKAKAPNEYLKWCLLEGFRVGNIDKNDLIETGCIIKTRRK